VVEREEIIEGFEYDYADIYFTDPDGDAVAVTYREVSTSLPYRLGLTDDPIEPPLRNKKGRHYSPPGVNARSGWSGSLRSAFATGLAI